MSHLRHGVKMELPLLGLLELVWLWLDFEVGVELRFARTQLGDESGRSVPNRVQAPSGHDARCRVR